ncbi:hypothetical protein F5X71_20100 [Nocardia brasiliensis]|uniref:Uncharacterized protein n=1 Tax=Nocardia brasiliensis TaxID=37326 RepID=A0A6G9XTU7_NOCBR|nr:hypothetical protein [Nocardia brasiliensis]QIS04325.1 hypothetical protein F5X71_20100 [Nocardia brasiliensis]
MAYAESETWATITLDRLPPVHIEVDGTRYTLKDMISGTASCSSPHGNDASIKVGYGYKSWTIPWRAELKCDGKVRHWSVAKRSALIPRGLTGLRTGTHTLEAAVWINGTIYAETQARTNVFVEDRY